MKEQIKKMIDNLEKIIDKKKFDENNCYKHKSFGQCDHAGFRAWYLYGQEAGHQEVCMMILESLKKLLEPSEEEKLEKLKEQRRQMFLELKKEFE